MRVCSVRSYGVALLVAAAMFELVGCGKSDRGSVCGTLLHKDGSPLVAARVVAHGKESGETAHAATDASGYFEIKDVLEPGDYVVNILEERGDPDNRRKPTIAAKYRNPAKSGINVSIQAGDDAELNLTLDSP